MDICTLNIFFLLDLILSDNEENGTVNPDDFCPWASLERIKDRQSSGEQNSESTQESEAIVTWDYLIDSVYSYFLAFKAQLDMGSEVRQALPDEKRLRYPDWLKSDYTILSHGGPPTYYHRLTGVHFGEGGKEVTESRMVIGWLLMKSGLNEPWAFASQLDRYGYMPLDDFRAWEPLFSTHRVENGFFIKHVNCRDVVGAEGRSEGSDEKGIMVYGRDLCSEDKYECFLKKEGTIFDWMHLMIDRWGYDREKALGFFGKDGFLSNLYGKEILGDYSGEDFLPILDNYINCVILPAFDLICPPQTGPIPSEKQVIRKRVKKKAVKRIKKE